MPAPPRSPVDASDTVQLRVDGSRIEARRGEPVAMAIVRSGRLVFGRSVKYHRPRGPICFSGRCDGCLMRVDGVASVTTCRLPAADGMELSTQNVLGTAEVDLLELTDLRYPDGVNHHEMFTWNRTVNRLMQKVARQIAGVGKLPDEVLPPMAAPEVAVDALVVGAGAAGLAAARRLGTAGWNVHVVDEDPEVGGRARVLSPGAAPTDVPATVRLSHSALAAYDPWETERGADGPPPSSRTAPLSVVVAGSQGLTRYRPRALVWAAGRHETPVACAGNDTPGVFSLEGAARLLAAGVLPGERVLGCGDDPDLPGLLDRLRDEGVEAVGPYPASALRRVSGHLRVSSARLEVDGDALDVRCDAIIATGGSSAVFEVPSQAGVEVRWAGAGWELGVDDDGRTAVPDVRVAGRAAGALEDPGAHGARVAAALVREAGR